jgi:tetratricopeptide (TPR) repeat protein
LADAYTLLCEYGLIAAEEAYPKAKDAATRAFEIDDQIAETHTSIAYVKLLLEWDWKGAEESFKKAIQINSNYATVHQWYSFYLILQNRVEESIKEQQLALELDPLSVIINKGFGHRYLNARQYEKTIESQLQTLEIEPKFAPSYQEMGYAYIELGKCEEAIKAFQEAIDISGGLVGLTAPTIGYGYAKCGKRQEALEILEQYKELAKESYVNPYFFAVIYAGLGEWEESLEWLEKSYQLRSPTLVYLKVNPVWDPIRSDPRFILLCSKIWPDDY